MIGLIGAFLSKNWISLALVGGILLGVGAIYMKGRSDGSASAEHEAKTAVVNQIRERNDTDAKVNTMSRPDICRAIGGVWRDDGCQ